MPDEDLESLFKSWLSSHEHQIWLLRNVFWWYLLPPGLSILAFFGQIAWETAPFAIGQHKGLAGPGQNGNMVLSGHISSPNEGAVFHSLPDLKICDPSLIRLGLEERLDVDSSDCLDLCAKVFC